jgi:predicted S18 family serine protease
MKKFLATLTVLTAFATPAFAQSFDPDNGTGNVLSFSHNSTVRGNVVAAVRQSGLHSFAMAPGHDAAINSNSPAATGGGSLGYNELLRIF